MRGGRADEIPPVRRARVRCVDPARTSHGPVAADIAGPMGTPWPTATSEQRATFDRGIEVMEHRFDYGEGLGPAFNVTFCGSCHEKPVFGGGSGGTAVLEDGDFSVSTILKQLESEMPVPLPIEKDIRAKHVKVGGEVAVVSLHGKPHLMKRAKDRYSADQQAFVVAICSDH